MTTAVSRTVPPVFEMSTPETWNEPWPMYAALRDHDPVHHVIPADRPSEDYYVLSRHADVHAAALDHELFSSADGLTVIYGDMEMLGLRENPPLVMQDPPSHTQMRKLVSRGFTPRQVTSVEPAVRAFVVERLENLRARGGGDIVAELFKPLPSMVVAHYLGVPEEDRSRFDAWTEAIVGAGAESMPTRAQRMDSAADRIAEMAAYFTSLIQRRRTDPADDVVSHLVATGMGADGDFSGMLSILALTFNLVTGGNDTTTGLLGGTVQLLEQNPAQRRKLTDDFGLIPLAIEELLRLTSPVQALGRTVTRDVTIEGTSIPAGRKALLLYGSANRDERQYGSTAGEFNVNRDPRNIMTFSRGAHHCLGAAAVRMQSRVVLEELLGRMPTFEIGLNGIVWAAGAYVRRPTSVPVTIR
ncbi:cytochrome P450 [Mycobacteroides abscessus subsp. massiliense]|uniref:cytochrome P450 n=1 Tax=Mycobacteroides abscessus TaxID=36809 RepID=UPI0009A75B2F|nr:cytochrome P450 [Mycobacteroides abscessus]SKT55238.1 cytochrome P450 [Mycobacteroides abscessus subsp. massiliense]